MPSNLTPNLEQPKLKQLHKLLEHYMEHIKGEQPLAAEVIRLILQWISDDIQ